MQINFFYEIFIMYRQLMLKKNLTNFIKVALVVPRYEKQSIFAQECFS